MYTHIHIYTYIYIYTKRCDVWESLRPPQGSKAVRETARPTNGELRMSAYVSMLNINTYTPDKLANFVYFCFFLDILKSKEGLISHMTEDARARIPHHWRWHSCG